MIDITIKNDGTIEPFGLKFLRESNLQLMAPTRDIKDSSDEFDGEMDFGTELKSDSWMIVGVTDNNLNATEKAQIRRTLSGQLYEMMNGGYLKYESDPNKRIIVSIDGRAEIEEYPSWLKVSIPLKVAPFWTSIAENIHTGTGMVTNKGTMDTPMLIEIGGPVSFPEIIINNAETLKYLGSLSPLDVLAIKTAILNGENVLGDCVGEFPKLKPGSNLIYYDAVGGSLTVKWHDRWI